MSNVVSTVIKFLVTGQNAAVSAMQGVSKASGVATRSMATLATSLGSAGGSLGKAAGQAANFMASIQQMGAIGGIIAGAQIAITQISDYFIEKANKMKDAVDKMATKVRDRLDSMNKARMDGVKKALEEATVKAKEAASAFDTLAESYLKVSAAKDATAKSGSDAAASALTLEKSEKMSAAKDKNESALVGAQYDVAIAETKAQAVEAEQERSVRAAQDEAEIREKQVEYAEKALRKAERALKKADKVYSEDQAAGNDRNLEKSKAAFEAASKARAEAENDLSRKIAESDAANERLTQAENARVTALNEARRGIIEAREAEKRLVQAQTEAAKAEIERINEKREADAREAAERRREEAQRAVASQQEAASALAQQKSVSKSAFEQSFDLWRDPAAAQQAQDAAKAKDEDLKKFRKSVDRYGGKWRIDEAAALMRDGDDEGLQSKLREWRKSSKFNGQTEQMVLAEAARQNEHSADKALAEISKTSADINAKLETIKAAFERSAE